MLPKSHYYNLRTKYQPSCFELVFVLESPPASGKYFYDPDGKITEPLFAAMMKVIKENPTTKKEALTAFAEKGLFIIDATYEPVNHIKNENERDKAILAGLPELIVDLKNTLPNDRTPLILIKANICRLLRDRLQALDFNVINDDEIIPFPSHNHQSEFHQRLLNLFRKQKIRLN
jgi:hypothetical protein